MTVDQPQSQIVYQYTARIDHNFTDKYRSWRAGRPTITTTIILSRTESGFDFLQREDIALVNHLVVDLTSALCRPNLINDFNFVRVHNRLEYFPSGLSPSSGINIPLYFPVNSQTLSAAESESDSAIPQRVPGITLVNYAGINPSTPWSNFESIYDLKDNLTWIKGAHTLKTGFDFAYEHKFEPTVTDVWGVFTFDGKQTTMLSPTCCSDARRSSPCRTPWPSTTTTAKPFEALRRRLLEGVAQAHDRRRRALLAVYAGL